ncbi:FAD-binding protein [Niallia sp. 03133]|uniref:FAD-binding protein n=1 Tax=Niallia sp. 03133 TaxID=3458060 RepID=UPI00404484C9
MTIFKSEVLIIGGGEAGLRAAIEARKHGAEVTLVSKGTAGKAGASSLAVGTHSAITLAEDSIKEFEKDILKNSHKIADPQLVRKLAEGSVSIIEDLQSFGVDMIFESDLCTPGHRFHRRWHPPTRKGTAVTVALRDTFQHLGGKIVDKVNVVDLICTDGVVYGAIAEYQNNLVAFIAGKTILASGGLGYLYRYTDNPADIKGDGIFMAWKHGAILRDMEFVQFYPYWLTSPRSFDIGTKLFSQGAIMLNEKGERIMDKFPSKELETRDIVSHTMALSGKVYLNLNNLPLNTIQQYNPKLYKIIASGKNEQLLLNPVEHYSLGGIEINERCQTSLQGLLACGECTGGVHGANRLGGNALTEALVFGKIAGEEAVNHFKMDNNIVNLAIERIKDSKMDIDAKQSNSLKIIRGMVSKYLGVERSIHELEKCIHILENDEELNQDPNSAKYCSLIKLMAKTCLYRKESRGAHSLIEYPNQDGSYDGNIRIQLNDGKKEEITFLKSQFDTLEENYV